MDKKSLISQIIYSKNKVFYLLFKLFSPFLKDGHILTEAYSFVRYVDDTIDDPSISLDDSFSFLNDYFKKIDAFYLDDPFIPISDYDNLLIDFLTYDKDNHEILKEPFLEILQSIYYDIGRINKLLTKDELFEYSFQMGSSFIKFISHFLGIPKEALNSLNQIACYSCQAYMLKDIKVDLEKGYINISKEDLLLYNIDLDYIQSKELKAWMIDQISFIEKKMLNVDLSCLKSVSFISKIILFLFLSPRLYVLKYLKRNGTNILDKIVFGFLDYPRILIYAILFLNKTRNQSFLQKG